MRKSALTKIIIRLLHILARNLPGAMTVRPFLHRLRGVKLGSNVWIGDDVYLENEYPECVEIHDNVGVNLRAVLLAHTRGPGKIIIERDTFIGCGAVITCAPHSTLTIGRCSVISANTTVTKSIPPFSFVVPPQPKIIATVTKPFYENIGYEDFILGLKPVRKNAAAE